MLLAGYMLLVNENKFVGLRYQVLPDIKPTGISAKAPPSPFAKLINPTPEAAISNLSVTYTERCDLTALYPINQKKIDASIALSLLDYIVYLHLTMALL